MERPRFTTGAAAGYGGRVDLDYQEHSPAVALRRHILCYWSLRGTSLPAAQTIVPDGRAELLLNCGDVVTQVGPGGAAAQARLSLVGEVRRPVTIAQGRAVDLLGVRLLPGALGVLFDEPPQRLVDGTLDLEAVLTPSDRAGLRAALEEAELSRRIGRVEAWLLGRLRRSRLDDRLVRRAVGLIDATHGATPVEALAEELGVQRRSLERAFKAVVGVSPKSLSRVRRFRAALGLIEGGLPFAEAGLACGYFDQAHLSADFRSFAGKSPSAYLASLRQLDQLFVANLQA